VNVSTRISNRLVLTDFGLTTLVSHPLLALVKTKNFIMTLTSLLCKNKICFGLFFLNGFFYDIVGMSYCITLNMMVLVQDSQVLVENRAFHISDPMP